MYKVRLVPVSGNGKTGPIPVSTTQRASCPSACPLRDNGCYAESGHSRIHWDKLDSAPLGGNIYDWEGFTHRVRALPKGTLWRHNEAGDLPSIGGIICKDSLGALVKANKGRRGFTYSHHDLNQPRNVQAIREANQLGFTINGSANNAAHADQVAALDIPTTCLLPMGAPSVSYTPMGRKIVACPAEKSKKVTCATCQLCQDGNRDYIIGFRAHGTSKRKANLIATKTEA